MKTKNYFWAALCCVVSFVPVKAQSSGQDCDDDGYYNQIEKTDVYKITDDEGFSIVLDGVADEIWNRVPALNCGKIQADWGVTPVANTDNFACSFKLLYDEGNLYIYFNVTDPTLFGLSDYTPEKPETIDNVELFFYPNVTERALVDGTVHDMRSAGLSQIRIALDAAENYVTGGGYAMSHKGEGANSIDGLEFGTTRTETGWAAEVVIPWDVIVNEANIDNAREGGKLMFDISAANVRTEQGAREIMMAWSMNDFQGWKDNGRLGEITLVGMAPSKIDAVELSEVDFTFNGVELNVLNIENGTNVSILDLSGRVIETYVYNGRALNLATLNSGMYLVQVENAAAFKIVK